jgi:hypothetical protein
MDPQQQRMEAERCPKLDKLLEEFTFISCEIASFVRFFSGLFLLTSSAHTRRKPRSVRAPTTGGVEMSMGCHSCAEKVAFNLSVPGLSDYVEHGFNELYKSAADPRPCSQPAPWREPFLPEEYQHRMPWTLPLFIKRDTVLPIAIKMDKLDKNVRLSRWDNFRVCEPPEACRCCRNADCLYYSMNGGLTDH